MSFIRCQGKDEPGTARGVQRVVAGVASDAEIHKGIVIFFRTVTFVDFTLNKSASGASPPERGEFTLQSGCYACFTRGIGVCNFASEVAICNQTLIRTEKGRFFEIQLHALFIFGHRARDGQLFSVSEKVPVLP